jgi:hypothetical protein
MPNSAKAYIHLVIAVGLAIAVCAATHWHSPNPIQFDVFLALFAGSALLKGRIPGIEGTYSPTFFFVLLGSHLLSFSQVIFAAALAGVVQCMFLVQRQPSQLQVFFNASNMIIATAAAFAIVDRDLPGLAAQPVISLLILASSVYYVVNTGLVSVVVTLVQGKRIGDVWRHWCLGSLPFYLFGALVAGLVCSTPAQFSLWLLGSVCSLVLLGSMYYRYWLRTVAALKPLKY